MHEELMIAGSGGQGVLFIGELICEAAMSEKKHTTWFPSYGPTMRGGKASCTVIVSSEAIGSPIAEHPDSLIVMNKLSLEFAKILKPGGLIVINKSLVDWDFSREDLEVLEIKANDIAQDLGDPRTANMVILGAYLSKKRIVGLQSIITALRKKFKKKELDKHLQEVNEKALKQGWDLVKNP